MLTTFSRQSGFTLVELVISLSLGLLVVGGVLAVYIPSLQSYKQINALSFIQENERYAFTLLTDAARQAGYSGCDSSARLVNIFTVDIKNAAKVDPSIAGWAFSGNAVRGYAADSTIIDEDFGTSFNNKRLKYDGIFYGDIFYLTSGGTETFVVDSHNPQAETITFKGDLTAQIDPGDLLTVNDCSHAVTFQIDNRDPAAFAYNKVDNTTTLGYSSDVSVNCNAIDENNYSIRVFLGGSAAAGCADNSSRAAFDSYTFKQNTTATKPRASVFYLRRPSNDPTPTLYRMSTTVAKGRLTKYTEQLLAGVENMRVLYGLDLNNDGIPDQYSNAKTINHGTVNWADVITMHVYLLLRSQAGKGEADQIQNFYFPDPAGDLVDCSTPFPDAFACPTFIYKDIQSRRYARRVIEQVFTLRNRQS